MKKWTRYKANPIFAHDTDGTITGDAQIVKMGNIYVMFYFSAFNPTREYNAYNTFAASRDMIHWYDWQEPTSSCRRNHTTRCSPTRAMWWNTTEWYIISIAP